MDTNNRHILVSPKGRYYELSGEGVTLSVLGELETFLKSGDGEIIITRGGFIVSSSLTLIPPDDVRMRVLSPLGVLAMQAEE